MLTVLIFKYTDKIYDSAPAVDRARYEMAALILITTLRISDIASLKPTSFEFDSSDNSSGADHIVVKRKTRERTRSMIPPVLWNKIKHNIDTYGRV